MGKVWVVTGYNGLLRASGPVAVAVSRERAEAIAKEKEYLLDSFRIDELELQQ